MPKLMRLFRRRHGDHLPVTPDISSSDPRDAFLAMAETLGGEACVLDVGTKQAVEGQSTHWKSFFPNVPRENYVMTDVESGTDVDVVADLHALPQDWTGRFDAVVAGAVFEHLERPWIAAKEVARVMASGAACYIATHQTYPIHAYPCDFFRFSKDALSLLFKDAGLEVIDVAYEHRIRLVMPRAFVHHRALERWNAAFPSYLCVHLYAVKP